MVQFFQIPQSRRSQLQEQLGLALGQGISKMTNSYFINKTIEQTLSDPKLKNAPVSKRLEAMQNALRPFGEEGENVLKQRMIIEQQGEVERKENAALKNLEDENRALGTQGINLSGIKDPQMRKAMLTQLMKQKEESQLYNMLFGGGSQAQNQQQMPSGDAGGMQQPQPSPLNPQQGFQPRSPAQGMAPQNMIPMIQPQGQQVQPPLAPQQQGQAPLNQKLSPDQIAMLGLKHPQMANLLQKQQDSAQKTIDDQNKSRTKKEQMFFNMNEPKIEKIAETERKLNFENARFSRLQQLFSDPKKFPSGLTAALFTKEGQLSDVAYSQLSPEAQEAVKLIIDSTSNIKDTYGARVTNLDLQTYLRKLPSLLNSHEGRMRVLRDLKDINDINQIYNRGIQEVFDEAGGTDKIPFSEAEKRFKKKYGSDLDKKLQEFASPNQTKFNEKPDPSRYLGKKIKDSDTGEIFISDGKEWKLEGK